MHPAAFKAMMLAWSYGVVLSNRKGKVYLAYAKSWTPDPHMIRAIKEHKEAILNALPMEIDA